MKLNNNTFVMLMLVVMSFGLSSCGYNEMVGLDEGVQAQWAQVETAYQRRSDLIGNLVETVKGAANFEKETLVEITEARSKASSIVIDPSNLTPESIKKFEQVQANMGGALSRLLATFERYPELKANKNFLELQAQLEGTENRISVERKKFNESVRGFNTYVRMFPRMLYAGMLGFGKKAYFESEEGADEAPKVDFN